MKKKYALIIAMIAILVVVLTVTACQKTGNGGKDNATDAPETEKKPLDDTPDIKDGILTFKEGDGTVFDQYSWVKSQKGISATPCTYEAWVKLPADYSGKEGIIIGDRTSATSNALSFGVAENGIPRIQYRYAADTNDFYTVDFDQAKLKTGEWVHIAIVDDVAANKFTCYINGESVQTITPASTKRAKSGGPVSIGGDGRDGNVLAFEGAIKSVVMYLDMRTADEIKADMKSINLNDDQLLACYDTSNSQGKMTIVDHKGEMDFVNNRASADWLEESQVPALTDYDYSLALIGDTQMLFGYYPEKAHILFDWLLANKDKNKIGHVLNMGDITNFNYHSEWENATEQYFRLNGILDYTLVRGDHDYKSDGIQNGSDKDRYDKFFGVDAYLSRFNTEGAGVCDLPNTSKTNTYRCVEIGGNKYLILTLDIDMTTALFKWANDVIDKYPDHKVLMTTHRYLAVDGTRISEGTAKFEKIMSLHKNSFFAICGHKCTDEIVYSKHTGVNGNVINEILVNPQSGGPGMENNGPLGMVALLYFKNGSDDIQIRYYSTVLGKYYKSINQFTVNTNNLEKPVRS